MPPCDFIYDNDERQRILHMAKDEENRKKNIHAGHRQRMRVRFMSDGFDNFYPHEVLELLLYEFIPRIDTNPVAHSLIERFGSVKAVLNAQYEDLIKVKKVGPRTAEGILSICKVMTEQICEHFAKSGLLTKNDIAVLADWFMEPMPDGSIGAVMCDEKGSFLAFVKLEIQSDMELFELGDSIVKSFKAPKYYLLIKNSYDTLKRETALILHDYTGHKHMRMLDTYVIDGYKPVSLLYPEK